MELTNGLWYGLSGGVLVKDDYASYVNVDCFSVYLRDVVHKYPLSWEHRNGKFDDLQKVATLEQLVWNDGTE